MFESGILVELRAFATKASRLYSSRNLRRGNVSFAFCQCNYHHVFSLQNYSMKVGIYNSCFDATVTGSASVATLARALSKRFEVEIVVNSNSNSTEHFAQVLGSSLERVSFQTVNELSLKVADPGAPGERYERLRKWSDELTSRYDLFINFADRLPIFCSATKGVLVIESPYNFVPSLYRAFWTDHLASYQLKLASSYYTRFWTKVFWDIQCSVVYPPLASQTVPYGGKENVIVVSGPITPLQHQLELVDVFRQLEVDAHDWSLIVMGHLDGSRSNKRYADKLNEASVDEIVSLLINPSAEQRAQTLRRSKLLWCGIGLEKDLDLEPHRIEPFRLDIVQAMANGCVPLTTNSASLSEVIRHRESGMFWDTTDELLEQTVTLAKDDALRQSFADAAQDRVRAFNTEEFTDTFLQELRNAFGIRSASLVNPRWLWKRLVRSADQFLVAGR
jgi:glycosyltransferase involved in cell wall biosynthesis